PERGEDGEDRPDRPEGAEPGERPDGDRDADDLRRDHGLDRQRPPGWRLAHRLTQAGVQAERDQEAEENPGGPEITPAGGRADSGDDERQERRDRRLGAERRLALGGGPERGGRGAGQGRRPRRGPSVRAAPPLRDRRRRRPAVDRAGSSDRGRVVLEQRPR